MIQELNFDEVEYVNGAGEFGDAISAVGEAGQAIIETAYNAGYMLGKSIRNAFF